MTPAELVEVLAVLEADARRAHLQSLRRGVRAEPGEMIFLGTRLFDWKFYGEDFDPAIGTCYLEIVPDLGVTNLPALVSDLLCADDAPTAPIFVG